jgi:Sec-independent protein translocase protein TatA
MFGAIGMPEQVIVSVIALMVFGPAKFPASGKSLNAIIRGLVKKMSDLGDCACLRDPRVQRRLNHVSTL